MSSNQREFRLLVTGGGTGGHTYPALTTLRALQARLAAEGTPVGVLWAGTADGLEATVTAAEGIRFLPVATGKLRRSSNPLGMLSTANMKDMARVPVGVAQARSIVSDFKPDVVLSTGGYVAVPVGLAANMLRRPLVVHEQTVGLGLANRLLAKRATRVAVSSPSTLELLPERVRERAVVTGNPVRAEMMTGEPLKAVDALGLDSFDPDLPVLYVTGGAQGAVQINTLVTEALPWLLQHTNVIHQCGPNNLQDMFERTATLPAELAARYRVMGFVGAELPDVLALADVVVSRSGAGTIAELTALGKPAVLVPLASSAGNEQSENARRLQALGAAITLEGDLHFSDLRGALAGLLADPGRRARMADAARSNGHPDAAERLVDLLLEAARSV
ncbi:glycosyltransferase [Promicromonospora thailandica]|uniref:UDP-N-acetylglucosamine--N-acetylmuramyl-(pentapeptide) pyrophosphoryl-undecaprenol N-acetylglucosamine transferase n=1 Tax=Promicromonospora thailandica TaxID=765201 RepID=A0A9X2G2R8_9MICO|nr:UDP-N-acetylglucosamine--N-acetylmuramyl-(pentapeptide) pyrophosphoryl-undecaprenol N-acetylglucosamine transferase [Promicromonospora thailandica]MCP2264267.1 UDP-N-acetylglucosamine--N-acetylmuramyl-(pentapeptide) pyrophosphoryl-undecaprenol N-acetylglucosamine transferase [Promicromonospora thailandica]BFF21054.1 undecaprenyldiphospho-muramoylpentapeptide beta-N-acetylglucosaminyltransferase [Promicromonospora thailandica]